MLRIAVPPDRYGVMLDAYRSWRELVKVLDKSLPMAEEPAAAPRAGGAA